MKIRNHWHSAQSQMVIYPTLTQARNQLGTPGVTKGFLRGSQIFKLCPIVFNYAQHIFPGGSNVFAGGSTPCAPIRFTGLLWLIHHPNHADRIFIRIFRRWLIKTAAGCIASVYCFFMLLLNFCIVVESKV